MIYTTKNTKITKGKHINLLLSFRVLRALRGFGAPLDPSA